MTGRDELISLVCPTRNRPDNVVAFVESARRRADSPDGIQFVFYVDEDDLSFPLGEDAGVTVVRGPRVMLSMMSNVCLPAARGEILMYAGDDLRFVTEGWDGKVRRCFEEFPDGIVLVHGDDMGQDSRKLATHGFLHRRWVDTVGYFLPPYFPADWTDTWLTELADRIGRRWYLPDLLIEHQHYAWGKGVVDQTHLERLARIADDHPGWRFRRLRPERRRDATKLAAQTDGRRLPTIKRLGLPAWRLPRRQTFRPLWPRRS